MVNITNGVNHMTVTAGAFKEIFAPQGWTKVEESAVAESSNQEETTDGGSNVETDTDDFNSDESATADDESDEEDEIEDDEDSSDDELDEKPLSEMSYEELQRYAALKNVEVTGLRSKKEIRQRLREKL